MFGWMMATRTVTYEMEAETKVEAEATDRRSDAWGACESISFERMDTNEAFDQSFGKLDVLYRYTQEVEFPGRCDALFGEFSRLPKQTLNAYVLRHGQELSKLREAGLDLQGLLAGWHMMTRSTIPRLQIPNLKTLCNSRLTMQVVTESLKTMLCGDSTAHKKDIERLTNTYWGKSYEGGDSYWAEEGGDDAYWYEDGCTDELYYEDDVWHEEDEEPIPELEDAYEAPEEAFTNYMEARAKMRELATARGSYQVVALMDDRRGADEPEDAKMLYEIRGDMTMSEIAPSPATTTVEEVSLATATGMGVGDSGATKPVMGLEGWPAWLEKLQKMGLSSEIHTATCHKTFRFGNDETATAKQQVTCPVWAKNARRQMIVYLVSGRGVSAGGEACLEEWGMVIDHRNNEVMHLEEQAPEWIDMETNETGHMIIDMLSFPSDVPAADEESSSTDSDTAAATATPTIENAGTTKLNARQPEDWLTETNRTLNSKPKAKRRFWEIFVAEGRIQHCVEKHGGFKTEKFTLETGWDFTNGSHRTAFMGKLVKEE
ncbi:unnamed protein product, partial [Prorocentrum cordatum]